jgi:hypothetical protein
MPLRRLALSLILTAVAGTVAGCIVVPAGFPPRAVYAPAPPPPGAYAPPPCRWFWVYNHWECR